MKNNINIEKSDGYYIYINDMKKKLNSLKNLLENNKYDGIVNATDPDIFGQLEYEYLREQLEFSGEEKRMICEDFTDESIFASLKDLKDNKEYLKFIKIQHNTPTSTSGGSSL